MRKIFICILLCVCSMILFAPLSAVGATGSDGSVTISSSKTSVEVGESFDVYFAVNAKNVPVGAVNFTVNIPSGITQTSYQILVSQSDFMLSSYDQNSGYFGCSMTMNGKSGTFNVLKLTLKSTVTGSLKIGVILGNMFKVDGATKLDFGTVNDLTITSKTPAVRVTGVNIAESVSLNIGEQKKVSYTLTPTNATNKSVSFSSGNTSVATVNSSTGEIKGIKVGTATITIKTADGSYKDTCVVTVKCAHKSKTVHSAGTSTCTVQANAKYYSCNTCGTLFAENSTTVITTVPKLPLKKHTAVKVEKSAYIKTKGDCKNKTVYYQSCSACGIKLADMSTFEGLYGSHKLSDSWSQNGIKHFKKCLISGCTYKGSEANCTGGHATCKEKAVCTICKFTYGELNDHIYSDTDWDYMDAKGHAYKCKTQGCDKYIKLYPHTPNISAATEDQAQVCVDCGYIIAVPLKHEHKLVLTPQKDATCINTGNIKYYSCSCGKWFKDSFGTDEITDKKSITIPIQNDHKDDDDDHKCDLCGNELSDFLQDNVVTVPPTELPVIEDSNTEIDSNNSLKDNIVTAPPSELPVMEDNNTEIDPNNSLKDNVGTALPTGTPMIEKNSTESNANNSSMTKYTGVIILISSILFLIVAIVIIIVLVKQKKRS